MMVLLVLEGLQDLFDSWEAGLFKHKHRIRLSLTQPVFTGDYSVMTMRQSTWRKR